MPSPSRRVAGCSRRSPGTGSSFARSPASVAIRTGFRPNTCEPDFDPLPSADGRRLLARARAGAGLWTVEGRRVAGLTPPARPAAVGPNVGAAALNADGTIVAAAGAPNGCVRYAKEAYTTGVWMVSPPVLQRTLPSDGGVLLDLPGRLIVADGALWPGHGGPRVDDLGTVRTLSPDGKRVLVDRNGRLEIAATASGKTVAPLDGADALREELDLDPSTASFSPDGSRLLTPWGTRARLWDATSGEPIALLGRPGEEIESATFGGDGHLSWSCSRIGRRRSRRSTASSSPASRARSGAERSRRTGRSPPARAPTAPWTSSS